MTKLHLITYGCQMNEYDSERVVGLLKAQRYELTAREAEADVILLNTCAVREKCEDKVYSKLGELRRLKARKPELVIGVMGCMAQLRGAEIQRRASAVDLVFGSPAIARVSALVAAARAGGGPLVDTAEAPLVKITTKPDGTSRLKSFVTVMEGCEKGCTFCVVPTTRGRQRSHPPQAILAEIRSLADEGCREVTLLGQTVEMYGRDLAPSTDLAALLEQVATIDGIERIRFTTSNPFNFTHRLIAAIRDVPQVCEWVHLPLQSGSDRVLARMNRGYTRARYLELVGALREAVPDVALSTDLIVGFPGETEDDFAATLHVVEHVRYDNVFAFRFSPRPGTPAATMPDQIPLEVKARRNTAVLEVATAVGLQRARVLQGRTVEVLVDGRSKKTAGEVQGRTRGNRVVNFEAPAGIGIGDVVNVRVTDVLPHSLRGIIASLPEEAVCLSR